MFGIEFYPTPEKLVHRMCKKIDFSKVSMLLDPQAGKGDMINGVISYVENNRIKTDYSNYHGKINKALAIEIDPALQAVLSSNEEITVIDSDFLDYDGMDYFNLIMMNPPFSNGDEHLLKAINVMFCGQIGCLLNAETIRNPYTNTRKLLARKLDELGAQIEYIEDAFIDSERKTGVEVAFIYIDIQKDIKNSIFDGVQEDVKDIIVEDVNNAEVVTHNDVERRVIEYNHIKQLGVEYLKNAYKHHKKLGKFISTKVSNKNSDEIETIHSLQTAVSSFTRQLRHSYWMALLDAPEIRQKLTNKTIDEYSALLHEKARMEFNERNIRTVYVNLQNAFFENIENAILYVFDEMSREYAWTDEFSKNIYMFNGWKTNKSWKVNNKVIIPNFRCFEWGSWRVPYDRKGYLSDIDLVMSYFDGGNKDYVSITKALECGIKRGETRNIESTYFIISCFKKGTIHLTFKNEDILRRFNVFAAKNKGWLPPGYGQKSTAEMTEEEKEVVKSFDGKLENYQLLQSNEELLRLAA